MSSASSDTQAQIKSKNQEDKQDTSLFRLTNARVITGLAAGIVFLATYLVNNIINSPHDRIDAMVGEIDHIHKELDELKYELAQTQRNDLECDRRNDRQQDDIDMLKGMGGQCVNWRAKAEVEIIQLKQIYDWFLKIKRIPD